MLRLGAFPLSLPELPAALALLLKLRSASHRCLFPEAFLAVLRESSVAGCGPKALIFLWCDFGPLLG